MSTARKPKRQRKAETAALSGGTALPDAQISLWRTQTLCDAEVGAHFKGWGLGGCAGQGSLLASVVRCPAAALHCRYVGA